MSNGLSLAGWLLDARSLKGGPWPLERVEPSPCMNACPAGVNVKSYVSLIAAGRYQEALAVVRQRCPLPGVCGRVCTHPCESACNRAEVDAPVAIRALKRFVADVEEELPTPRPDWTPPRMGRVAVIGSGPAGLTAAWDLSLAGWPVDVFEAEAEPGGMLRYGIAEYRLPRPVLEREIELFLRAGVQIHTGRRLGREIELEQLLHDGYRAVLLAVGTQRGRGLGLEDERVTAGVEDALGFLRRANAGERKAPGRRVLVIGGGSTAIEAARMARRLGAEQVSILYRRSEQEMPASHEEIEQARAEGVELRILVAPTALEQSGGRVSALMVQRMRLGEPDASGRRRPVPVPDSEERVEADSVLAAIGQQADLSFLPTRGRTQLVDDSGLVVEAATTSTRLNGVFAAGDVVTGPATVIEAIAAGHRSAEAIALWLQTGRMPQVLPQPPAGDLDELQLKREQTQQLQRHDPRFHRYQAGEEFDEVESGLEPAEALAEASRCLRCGPCSECSRCVGDCGHRSVLLGEPGLDAAGSFAKLRVPRELASQLEGQAPEAATLWRPASDERPQTSLPIAVQPARAHIEQSLCRGCASCVEACAFDAIQMRQHEGKPVAHIDDGDCRGCNMCTAACPTGAAQPARHWWGEGEHPQLDALAADGRPLELVLACERTLAQHLPATSLDGAELRCLALSCAGELQSGQLLQLHAQGAARINVVSCGEDCRYGHGGDAARHQVELARQLLELMGADPEVLRLVHRRGSEARPLEVASAVAGGETQEVSRG